MVYNRNGASVSNEFAAFEKLPVSVNANQRCNKHKMVVSEAVNVYSTIQAMNSSKSLLSPPNMGNCFRNSLFMVIGCFAKSETDSQYTCTARISGTIVANIAQDKSPLME